MNAKAIKRNDGDFLRNGMITPSGKLDVLRLFLRFFCFCFFASGDRGDDSPGLSRIGFGATPKHLAYPPDYLDASRGRDVSRQK